MRIAIEEAKRGIKTAFPNPMVGAVLVDKNQKVIAKGFHEKPGSWHAERMALSDVEIAPQGATLYVTLEPCCSWGRTPPCIDIIQEKRVSRVVVGMLDPDIRMRGKSIERLRKNGVVVEVGVQEEACRSLNQRYLKIRSENRPTVAIKAACSVDGRIGDVHNDSKWITSKESRMHSHRLRNIYDGILIGSGTLIADNPSLNCRLEGGRNPTPIILDTHARCPSDAKVLTAGKRPILCVASDACIRNDLNVDYLLGEYDGSVLNIRNVLEKLYQKGIYTVLVEGGSKVHMSLIKEQCVDILELYIGGVFLGGGSSWGAGINFQLEQAPKLNLRYIEALGSDVYASYFWES
ncbi:MAG: riboflavin biosynthesis protein RibD [Deltaproteobacteria bacterium]|nr:riboflavin biosynthesis protein RibD [Deltaproteobacteria bacterium]